jgi:hypothetical protein
MQDELDHAFGSIIRIPKLQRKPKHVNMHAELSTFFDYFAKLPSLESLSCSSGLLFSCSAITFSGMHRFIHGSERAVESSFNLLELSDSNLFKISSFLGNFDRINLSIACHSLHSLLLVSSLLKPIQNSPPLHHSSVTATLFTRRQHWLQLLGDDIAHVCLSSSLSLEELLEQSSHCNIQVLEQIARDVPRSPIPSFSSKSSALHSMLRAYAVFDPEIGYAQGMNVIASVVLIASEFEDAFWIFSALMQRRRMRAIYRADLIALSKSFDVWQSLIEQELPDLAHHFSSLAISPSFFAPQWLLGMWAHSLPISCALKVWDVFLSHGWGSVFACGIAVLKMLQSTLLKSSFDETMCLLNDTKLHVRDWRQLFTAMQGIGYDHKAVSRWHDECLLNQ